MATVGSVIDAVNAQDWESLRFLLAPQIRVTETEYEVQAGSCATHYRDQLLETDSSFEDLKARFARLVVALKYEEITRFEDGKWGVVGFGDCEHVWSIEIDNSSGKIVGIQVDAL